MAESSVAIRLADVLRRLESAVKRAERSPNSTKLLAISKLHDLDKMKEAHRAGQRAFGENYVREAVEKVDAWPAADVEWHFVGRIQSNKVRDLANRFAFIHSIERLEIAERLDRVTESRQNIFVQMNVANEASKGGVTAAEVEDLVAQIIARCPKLNVVGLMVMPPLSDDPEATRPHFRVARETLARLRARHPGHPLDQLSMGTSGDFEVAIAEGATWIRIGTDVFGPRTKD